MEDWNRWCIPLNIGYILSGELMAAKKEMPRCSLDEFLESNPLPIQPYCSKDILFVKDGTSHLIKKEGDLALLTGGDFALETRFVNSADDIRRGKFWIARILDNRGEKTGYQLGGHGVAGYKTWYGLETDITL